MILFPPDSYMRALAEAIYTVSYLEWLLLGDLPKLSASIPGFSIEELSRDTMGKVASETRAAISKTGDSAEKAWLSVAADALVAVVRPRNSVLHARPASSSSGHQTLFRFAAARGKESHESHEITETFLLDLKALACEHITKVNAVRLS